MGTIHHGNAYAVLNQQIQNLYATHKDLAANAATGRNQVALRNVQQIEDHLAPIRACLDLLIRGADPGVAPTPKSNKVAEATNAEPAPPSPPAAIVAPAPADSNAKPKPVNPLGGLRKPKQQ
jgi:hypothetical protein